MLSISTSLVDRRPALAAGTARSLAGVAIAATLLGSGCASPREPRESNGDAGLASLYDAARPPSACVPNMTVSCLCPGGSSGTQTCNTAGTGFVAACACGTIPTPDAGPSCQATGSTCTVQGDCCSFLDGDGSCVDYGTGARCADGCSVDSDCNSGCCAVLTNGARACGPASACQGGIGDPCTSDTQCLSGLSCTGTWCTTSCSSSLTDCPGLYSGERNSSGQLNWCVSAASGSDVCFPGCYSNADCAAFPGTSCRSTYTNAGTAITVCAR